MAADDEFPRGWVIAQRANGAQVAITVPASAGVTHILTDVLVGWTSLAALNTNLPIEVQSPLGNTIFSVGGNNSLIECAANFAAVDDNAQFSWSGKIAGRVGQALIVDNFGSVPNLIVSIVIMGYDI